MPIGDELDIARRSLALHLYTHFIVECFHEENLSFIGFDIFRAAGCIDDKFLLLVEEPVQ